MSQPHILLLGGHGKVSLLLTRKIIARSWSLTSVIRDPKQKDDILAAAGDGPGKVDVLVESLDDVKSESDAKRILELVKPSWVVWSAGAGGKGGVSRTNAIDRDAASYFIRASIATPSITKFLIISAIASRRKPAPWWTSQADKDMFDKQKTEVLPDYYKAKIVADETLTVLGEERKGFEYIVLRPGALIDDDETGRIVLGKTGISAKVTRGDVAEVAAALLEKDGVKGWFDLVGAESGEGGSVVDEVDRVINEGVNAREGEDFEEAKKSVQGN